MKVPKIEKEIHERESRGMKMRTVSDQKDIQLHREATAMTPQQYSCPNET